MLQKNRTYLIATFASIAALGLAIGCGGDDEETTPTPEATGGSGGEDLVPDEPCDDCIVPPGKPDSPATAEGPGTTLAISKLYLGDFDREGIPSTDAWKTIGYDLDGFASTRNSGTHCKLQQGANPSKVKTDGEGGIDNSFGANLVGVISNAAGGASDKVNESIDEGSFTIILGVDKVGGDSNYVDLPAALYAGASLDTAPLWDGTDEWPVFCELMDSCSESGTPQVDAGNKSKVQFPASYMADGTWVSGAKGTVSLSLAISGFALNLNIRQAVITAEMGAGTPPTTATNGVIAGIIDAAELIDSLSKIAGNISPSLCSGPTFDSIAQQIKAASDIGKEGGQDPDATCEGISVGIGFDMKAVTIGTVLDKAPPGDDPCAAE